jgi:hypothetical protein
MKEQMIGCFNRTTKRAERRPRPFPFPHVISGYDSILESLPQKNLDFQRNTSLPNPLVMTTNNNLFPTIDKLIW